VAIKRLDRQRLRTHAQSSTIADEIAVLKRLRHEHIVAFRDFQVGWRFPDALRWPPSLIDAPGRPFRGRGPPGPQFNERWVYIIVEYCAGGDLARYLRVYAPLEEALALSCLQQLGARPKPVGSLPVVQAP